MNFATTKMSDTQSVLAEIAARVPIIETDIRPSAWIERSSQFSPARAAGARKLWKVKPEDTKVAELFQCNVTLFGSTAQQREVAWPRLRPASIAPLLYLSYYKDTHAITLGQRRVSHALLSRKLDASLSGQFLEVYTINTSRSGLRSYKSAFPRAISGVAASIPGSRQTARRPISASQ